MPRSEQELGPAVQLVIDLILERIDRGEIRPGDLLPGRSELARIASVGAITVSRAVRVLKDRGLLEGIRGQRPRIALPPGSDGDHDSTFLRSLQQGRRDGRKNRSWDLVAECIKKDIIAGHFRPGKPFPTGKELQYRYQTSYETLRKSLTSLAGKKLIARQGSRYTVPVVSTPAGSSRIAFLWYSKWPLLPAHPMDTNLICILERECFRNMVPLEKLLVGVTGGHPVLRRHEDPRPVNERTVESCAGIVYLVNWPGSLDPIVLNWLNRLGKPVSIVDWLGGWELPESLAANRHIQVVRSVASAQPGFDVARYLADRGHRHIAYFTPSSVRWPATRLAGMREACALAGGVAHAFVPQNPPADSTMEKRGLVWHEKLRADLHTHPGIPREYSAGTDYLLERAWLVWENSQYYSLMAPCFGQALENKRITAWVGCTDFVAGMARCFLQAKKVAIPNEISLMGFGNSPETVKMEMTSYDFDLEATASAAVTFLLRPEFARAMLKLLRPRIGGFVIERGSTGIRATLTGGKTASL